MLNHDDKQRSVRKLQDLHRGCGEALAEEAAREDIYQCKRRRGCILEPKPTNRQENRRDVPSRSISVIRF